MQLLQLLVGSVVIVLAQDNNDDFIPTICLDELDAYFNCSGTTSNDTTSTTTFDYYKCLECSQSNNFLPSQYIYGSNGTNTTTVIDCVVIESEICYFFDSCANTCYDITSDNNCQPEYDAFLNCNLVDGYAQPDDEECVVECGQSSSRNETTTSFGYKTTTITVNIGSYVVYSLLLLLLLLL
jgi:hypothetical protein